MAVDLGTLGGRGSAATAVNDAGQVVGHADLADGATHAFSWTHETGIVDLGTLGGAASAASAVNPSGQVVGESALADGATHAFSWTQAGGLVDLGAYDTFSTYSAAIAVNASGQVLGKVQLRNRGFEEYWPCGMSARSPCLRAFLWTEPHGVTLLRPFGHPLDESVYPAALSDRGQVVGWQYIDGFAESFSWTPDGGTRHLGVPSPWSFARAVNEAGQVAGYMWLSFSSSQVHAFVWTEADGTIDLGVLGGPEGDPAGVKHSRAFGISGRGQVVGWSDAASSAARSGPRAFSWTAEGGMLDLGDGMAVAVNDAGQVVGNNSEWETAASRAFSWTPRGGRRDLGPGRVVALNANGEAVGHRTAPDGSVHAVLWKTDPAAELRLLAEAAAGLAARLGIQTSLFRRIGAASAALAQGGAACPLLSALTSELAALRGRWLTEAQVRPLVARARDIRAMLECR